MNRRVCATNRLVCFSLVLLLQASPSGYVHAEQARALYILHCGGCHRPHGNGALPEVPGLRDDLGKLVQVEGGRDYLVRVPGAAQSPISDRELQQIVNWILLEFNSSTLPEDFVPLSLDEVRAARADVLEDPLRYRRELWRRVTATVSR